MPRPSLLRPALLLAGITALAFGLTDTARAGALVNLIESSSLETGSFNRLLNFVELRDTTGRDREYSVPYIPDTLVVNYAADVITEWKKYADTVHWGQITALNNNLESLGVPHEVYTTACVVSAIGDISTAIYQGVAGKTWLNPTLERPKVDLKPRLDPSLLTVGDGVNSDFVLAPRVPSADYCAGGSINLIPDEGFLAYAALPGGGLLYEPGQMWCTPFGCLTSGQYPAPSWVNWSGLGGRMDAGCNIVNNVAYPKYEANVLKSLALNMPLAIHWNGATTVQGVRTGTSMAPFFALDPLGTENLKKVAELTSKNPLFPVYLTTGLPAAAPGVTDALDDLKAQLPAGTVDQQEYQGAATFMQTWQHLDTVIDARPITYYGKSFWHYCLFGCSTVPTVQPMLMPPTTMNGPTCFTPPQGVNNVPSYTGTSTYTTFRYHYGVTTVSEGKEVGNVQGTPLLRTDHE